MGGSTWRRVSRTMKCVAQVFAALKFWVATAFDVQRSISRTWRIVYQEINECWRYDGPQSQLLRHFLHWRVDWMQMTFISVTNDLKLHLPQSTAWAWPYWRKWQFKYSKVAGRRRWVELLETLVTRDELRRPFWISSRPIGFRCRL